MCLKGQCTLKVDGQEIILQPGILLTIEPGDIHQLHNHGSELFELLVFKTNSGPEDTFWIPSTSSEGISKTNWPLHWFRHLL